MVATFGQELVESLREALDHVAGQNTRAREHRIEVPDVRTKADDSPSGNHPVADDSKAAEQ